MSIEHDTPAYRLLSPKGTPVPFLLTVPHSGRHYPQDMLDRSILSGSDIRLSEDSFVDQLFENLPTQGAHLLVATHARAYVDLNRAANELDAYMFTPELDRSSVSETHRVKAGLGVIPRLVAEGKHLYSRALPAREADKRLQAVYHPYHSTLEALIKQLRKDHGRLYVIDCHSMPSSGAGRGAGLYRGTKKGPDIVLGDCWGSSCSSEFTSIAESCFLDAGFSVKRNVPYSGGFTTSEYSAPENQVHALQIEINRSVYMNEATHTPLPDFAEIKQTLTSVCQKIMTATLSGRETMVKMQQRQAAE